MFTEAIKPNIKLLPPAITISKEGGKYYGMDTLEVKLAFSGQTSGLTFSL